jgi:hypothetical protein
MNCVALKISLECNKFIAVFNFHSIPKTLYEV